MRAVALALLLALAPVIAPSPVHAVLPDEVLSDSGLEARARAISAGLRCLVCRSESIDESNAPFARDLRLLVRERLVAGDSDAQVVDYLVARFGEYVLLRPTARGANLILWLAAPAMLLAGGAIAAVYVRRRATAAAMAGGVLSPDEEARLKAILEQD